MFDDAKRWETYSSVLSLKGIHLAYSSEAATASYDLATQQVILPVWDCLDEVSTQALASHEIGHAKFSNYTLESFNDFFARYKDLFNVVEDARIERLMKKEFAGLNSIFKDGYSVLGKNGIFPLDGIETAPLVERLNVFAKFGFMVEVPFNTKEESSFAYRILNLSTKADVIDLCEDILQYLKKVNEEQKDSRPDARKGLGNEASNEPKVGFGNDEDDEDLDEEGDGSCASVEGGSDASEEQENNGGQEKEAEESDQEDAQSSDGLDSELNDSRTRDFQKAIEKEFQRHYNGGIKPVVLDSNLVLKRNYAELDRKGVALYRESQKRAPNGRRQVVNLVEKCAMEAASLFSQKKSAIDNFAKRRMHFGKIDAKKLAKYSISDAIFKTMEKLPKGKSHGIVLLLDLSISMATHSTPNVQRCACMQAAILGRFCQIVGIPFSIILFGCEVGDGWNRVDCKRVVKIADSSFLDIDFILTLGELGKRNHIFVSDVDGHRHFLCLGGSTPMLEALLAARKEVKAMRANGIEKAAIIVATDGGYTDRIYYKDSYINVDGMKRLLLDAKPFNVSDLKWYDSNRVMHINDWCVELFAGYVKKETGATIIFSSIVSEYDIESMYRMWKNIDEEGRLCASAMCRGGVEPYVFKHAWLLNNSIANIGKMNVLEEPCWSLRLDGKGVIDQYLVMNASRMQFNDAKQKDFNGLDDKDIAAKLCSHNKGLKAYKAFAKAFVDFFS